MISYKKTPKQVTKRRFYMVFAYNFGFFCHITFLHLTQEIEQVEYYELSLFNLAR